MHFNKVMAMLPIIYLPTSPVLAEGGLEDRFSFGIPPAEYRGDGDIEANNIQPFLEKAPQKSRKNEIFFNFRETYELGSIVIAAPASSIQAKSRPFSLNFVALIKPLANQSVNPLQLKQYAERDVFGLVLDENSINDLNPERFSSANATTSSNFMDLVLGGPERENEFSAMLVASNLNSSNIIVQMEEVEVRHLIRGNLDLFTSIGSQGLQRLVSIDQSKMLLYSTDLPDSTNSIIRSNGKAAAQTSANSVSVANQSGGENYASILQ